MKSVCNKSSGSRQEARISHTDSLDDLFVEFPLGRPKSAIHSNLPGGNLIDFSPCSDEFVSVALPPAEVKRPSKTLPSDYEISATGAFRMGARAGTGAATFYNLPNHIREAVGLLPKQKTGKLADVVKVARNDARTLYAHIQKLDTQFACVLACEKLDNKSRREATFLALYFLDTCHHNLAETLGKLKMYEGLVKGNAVVGYGGFIVAGKTPACTQHPMLTKKESKKACETAILRRIADERPRLQIALFRLRELDISVDDFYLWKHQNSTRIEVSLNKFRAAGCITGITIQGLITSAINFGIAAATLNPLVFAAGAYYAVSTGVRVVETAAKATMDNRFMRGKTNAKVKKKKTLSQLNMIESVEKIHNHIDGLANTAFGVSSMFALPVTTGRPSSLTETNVGAHNELRRIERAVNSKIETRRLI